LARRRPTQGACPNQVYREHLRRRPIPEKNLPPSLREHTSSRFPSPRRSANAYSLVSDAGLSSVGLGEDHRQKPVDRSDVRKRTFEVRFPATVQGRTRASVSGEAQAANGRARHRKVEAAAIRFIGHALLVLTNPTRNRRSACGHSPHKRFSGDPLQCSPSIEACL
jgi:hypothetical protein